MLQFGMHLYNTCCHVVESARVSSVHERCECVFNVCWKFYPEQFNRFKPRRLARILNGVMPGNTTMSLFFGCVCM